MFNLPYFFSHSELLYSKKKIYNWLIYLQEYVLLEYKIFHTEEDFKKYLSKNKDKACKYNKPVYISKKYMESSNAQIRKLNNDEIKIYLKEKNQNLCLPIKCQAKRPLELIDEDYEP